MNTIVRIRTGAATGFDPSAQIATTYVDEASPCAHIGLSLEASFP
jgi:hypothetical protein